ncbi:hypothetical protein [Haloferax sp. DFSO60]|uniref:hypothetical protein n=1 Tax=Haloferax sp. DFSO60 TaxID=3388652 RepID=UPI003977FFC7
MPSRRQYLARTGAGLGAALGLAGCLGELPQSDREPLAFGEEATTGNVTVTPAKGHPQASIFYVSNVDHASIERLDDEWVVFVSVFARSESGAPPSRDAFRLVAGDDEFTPLQKVGDAPLRTISPDERIVSNEYSPESGGGGWIAFTVPEEYESASDLELQFGSDEPVVHWNLPDDAKERIAGPRPTFEVVSFDVPEQVSRGEETELVVTARNMGPVDGLFRGCINTTGMYAFYEVLLPLEVGAEAATAKRLPSIYTREPGAKFSCELKTGADNHRQTVEVVSKSDDA